MNQDNQITIKYTDLELIKNESGKVVLNHNAEKFLVELLNLKDKVEQTLELCKGEIKRYMEDLDDQLVSVNTDNLRIMNRVYGSKYKLDTDLIEHLDKKFYTVKPTYSLNTKEVDEYIKTTDIIPTGISINNREKQVSISLKNKPEQGEIE